MNIKKLELQGFKSFSDRTRLIFHQGITAVIGPNGTGKSNIVDALLWVLGGRRLKGLRGERSGDVIFNGNTKVAPMGMADVTLVLGDNEEELNISHRVFRSKESEYRMDGKIVRLKDIQDTLYKKAIGDSQYFVIEQGSIGIFLSSKPIEKRTLLEEAAGTAFYKDRKRQAELKLENSEQNLTRLEDIIAEVSKAKNSLKRQANSAIRYRELREKIRELTLLNFRDKINRAEKSQHDAIQTYQKTIDLERTASNTLKSSEKVLVEKRKDLWNLENANKKEQENLYTLKNRLSQSETERERESKRIELVEEKRKRDAETKEELEQELLILEKDKEEAKKNTGTWSASLDRKLEELKSFDQSGQNVQEEIAKRQKNIAKLREKALLSLSELTEIRNSRAKFEKEQELFLRQEDKIKSEIDSERKVLTQTEERLKSMDEELAKEKRTFENKEKNLSGQRKTLKDLSDSLEKLTEQHTELVKRREKSNHHLSAIEQLLKKEISTWASTEIPGSIGLLADLIESDAKYTPAIDIFWRDESKSQIVPVDKLLEELKKGSLKGNFLLLSSQKSRDFPLGILNDQRALGTLKAKVKPHPKIKEGLFPLQDAVIVKEIQDAVELWLIYPSYNFITAEGDVLHSTGLLSLGEKKEGILALNMDIKALKDGIAKLEEQISPLEDRIENLLEEQQKFEKQIAQEENDLNQIERNTEAQEKELSYVQMEREKIETNLILLQKEIDILSEDKKVTGERLYSFSSEIQALENKDSDFNKKIETEGQELARLQQKAEREKNSFFELKSQTDILKEKINNLQDRFQTTEQRMAAVKSKIQSLEKEIAHAGSQKVEMEKRTVEIEESTAKLEAEIKIKEKSLATSESTLNELSSALEELENKLEKEKEDYEAKKDIRVQAEIKKAEVERDLVNLEESCWQELRKTIQEVKEEVSGDVIHDENIEKELEKCDEQIQRIGNVNLMAEEEYTIQQKRYDFLIQEREDLRESIDSTKEAISKIDRESKSQFLTALEAVNENFKEVFSLLFEGGNAEVKLTDPNSPLESGVEIVAQPPGKRLQSLSLLSGGEKSLTSLAFFFALFRYKPTPFCILDEVDAALDEANLSRFLHLMKRIKSQTQFIIITHNSKTMEVADYIYGTTMAEPNITSVFSVKMEKNKAKEQ